MDGLAGALDARTRREGLAGIRVAIELREVAAGDVHPDSMSFLERNARADQVDLQLLDLAGIE
jgi:tRNA G26 N,N-dimethylase Trm1